MGTPEMPGMHQPSTFSRKIKMCSSIHVIVSLIFDDRLVPFLALFKSIFRDLFLTLSTKTLAGQHIVPRNTCGATCAMPASNT